MLGKLLAAGDFAQWSSFVTPAFFDVVPAKPLWRRFEDLARASRDREAVERVLSERRELLAQSALAIELEGRGTGAAPLSRAAGAPAAGPLDPDQAQARAAQVVELYFHQLLHGSASLLDLRRKAFSPGLPSRWRPAPWLVRWDPSFLAALRQLYAGFYQGDTAEFHAGLAALNLSSAEGLFRHHFGDGQRAVRFRVQDFVSTFHQVFKSCRQAHVQLHPDFLPLGLYLATLYDHLEQLGTSVDVFAAFQTASLLRPSAPAASPGSQA
jgi:hypothetical protein